MARLTQILRRSTWALLGAGALVAVAVVRPPTLPAQVDTSLAGSNTTKTVPTWYELNPDHYGKDASFGGGSACADFPLNASPTAPLYDGWHFVITPDDTSYNVDDWQIVFRDLNGTGSVHIFRVQVSGTTVTATPASAIRFSQLYRQIQVITPASAHYRLITATDSALIAPRGAPYTKTMYAHSADPTAVDTLGSTGNFNLSSTCAGKPITLFPHSDCVYPDDGSLLAAKATGGVVKGTLTCNGVPETDETVRFTDSHGGVTTAVTGTGSTAGAFSKSFATSAFPLTVSFPGSSTHAPAPSISVAAG